MWYVKNVPGGERVARLLGGALSVGAAFTLLSGPWAWLAAAAAAGVAVTGLVGFCPMCAMVGRKLARRSN